MEVDVASERIVLKCSCGFRSPISRLYFCKHCVKIRCGRCVMHEVDSYACPNCLENMPSAEAKLKRNRCPNCLECPSCNHNLTTRATSVIVTEGDDPSQTVTKKVYYVACALCRWTSRDVGIPDKSIASGGWDEPQSEHARRINELLEYYHQLAIQEKTEKEQKRYSRRRAYLMLQEKYLAVSLYNKRKSSALLSALGVLTKKSDAGQSVGIDTIEPVDDVAPLPSKVYTQPVMLEKITTLPQRISQPLNLPTSVDQFHPRHKSLAIKRSQRCKECDHNLCKPEYNPSSIRFKIQLLAIHHIPDVHLASIPKLKSDKVTPITIVVINPAQETMKVILVPVNQHSNSNAKIELPSAELTLAGKDITAEFEEKAVKCDDVQTSKESYVEFENGHKLGILCKVTPQSREEDIYINFVLKYTYKDTMMSLNASTSDTSPPDDVWLEHEVCINLGKVDCC